MSPTLSSVMWLKFCKHYKRKKN